MTELTTSFSSVAAICSQDSVASSGDEDLRRAAFHKVMARVSIFLSLPIHMLEKNAIQLEFDAIGEQPV
jgi:arsenate reductase